MALSRLREMNMRTNSWWEAHAETATAAIVSFLADCEISLSGLRVADLGSGDGSIAVGLALAGAHVVGFDLEPTDRDFLRHCAKEHGIDVAGLALEFRGADPCHFPAEDGEFDLAISWAVVEHAMDLAGFFAAAHRIVKPFGHLYFNAWPLWRSAHGHHLANWVGPYDHLRFSRSQLLERVRSLDAMQIPMFVDGAKIETVDEYCRAMGIDRGEWLETVSATYDACNQASINDIERAVRASGFVPARVELAAGVFIVPDGVDVPLAELAINGVQMVCWTP